MNEVTGKNVFITGASAGLGRAIAMAFAKAGANVGLIARTTEGLESVASEIAGTSSVRCAVIAADVADHQQLANAAETLERALGNCDIWVNNAMETIFSTFIDITPDEFRRVTEVNYLGYVYGTMEALKRMQPRNRGHIIQIGSALAYRSIPLQSAYCGSKFAIHGFTNSLRCELLHNKQNIALTMMQMPAMNTPQFSWARTHSAHQPQPVGDIFQPELCAQAVVHAARFPKREYWVGGPTVAAIIGNKLFPAWMDTKMASGTYDQQWVNGESPPARDGNLFAAAPVDLHTIRGRFDSKAKIHSITWAFTKWLSRFTSRFPLSDK